MPLLPVCTTVMKLTLDGHRHALPFVRDSRQLICTDAPRILFVSDARLTSRVPLTTICPFARIVSDPRPHARTISSSAFDDHRPAVDLERARVLADQRPRTRRRRLEAVTDACRRQPAAARRRPRTSGRHLRPLLQLVVARRRRRQRPDPRHAQAPPARPPNRTSGRPSPSTPTSVPRRAPANGSASAGVGALLVAGSCAMV